MSQSLVVLPKRFLLVGIMDCLAIKLVMREAAGRVRFFHHGKPQFSTCYQSHRPNEVKVEEDDILAGNFSEVWFLGAQVSMRVINTIGLLNETRTKVRNCAVPESAMYHMVRDFVRIDAFAIDNLGE